MGKCAALICGTMFGIGLFIIGLTWCAVKKCWKTSSNTHERMNQYQSESKIKYERRDTIPTEIECQIKQQASCKSKKQKRDSTISNTSMSNVPLIPVVHSFLELMQLWRL